MTLHPRLYLDVDGVLSADLNYVPWKREGSARGEFKSSYNELGVRLFGGEHYTARWNEEMIENLNLILDEFLVDLVMLTTWRQDAVDSIIPLMGIEAYRVRVLHPVDSLTIYPSIDWKIEALRADQEASPGVFMWVDDELNDLPKDEWIGIEEAYNPRPLLISPSMNYGITPAHIKLMWNYLERL